MESLNGLSDSIEESDKYPAKQSTGRVERIILEPNQAAIITRWTDLLSARADGLIRYSKSDVVNYLIATRDAELSQAECNGIASRCYDEARWLSWSLSRVRSARKSNRSVSLDELTRFRDSLIGTMTTFAEPAPRKVHRHRPATAKSSVAVTCDVLQSDDIANSNQP